MTKQYAMTFDVVKGSRKKSFEKFESLFLAYANVYGFGDIVKGTVEVPVIGEWDTDEDKKPMRKIPRGILRFSTPTIITTRRLR